RSQVTVIYRASSFLRERCYPFTRYSMGSPMGAVLITSISVPGMIPIARRRCRNGPRVGTATIRHLAGGLIVSRVVVAPLPETGSRKGGSAMLMNPLQQMTGRRYLRQGHGR